VPPNLSLPEPEAPEIPAPPHAPDELLAWAEAHGVRARLDDQLVGEDGPLSEVIHGRDSGLSTYRQILIDRWDEVRPRSFHGDLHDSAREYLHRMATLVAAAAHRRAELERHARDPEDDVLGAFLDRLRAAARDLRATARPVGTFEPVSVRAAREPAPLLCYEEWTLRSPRISGISEVDKIALLLLGWSDKDAPLRLVRLHKSHLPTPDVSEAQQAGAFAAMIDFVRDPRQAAGHELLRELLQLPAWQYALGTLDHDLSRLEAERGEKVAPDERVAYRVTSRRDGRLEIEPLLQKRQRSGFSPGAKLAWYNIPFRPHLTDADRRAFAAHDDRFARAGGRDWSGSPDTPAQLYGVLRALTDHPAVYLEGDRDPNRRLEIRQGRLRLVFAPLSDGALSPRFELLGLTLLPSEVVHALRDEAHLIHVHRPQLGDGGGPQVLLAQITPQAAAVVRALALAPTRFPPEAHDALATRLESLQETVDIEFPSQWTRTIVPADMRVLVRLELLGSGALHVRLGMRPVKLGPLYAPGEGPTLLLEGQGRTRHGARRDRTQERNAGHALAERLRLSGGEELEPWLWRVGEGDPAFDLVATLKDIPSDQVVVEWADDRRLLSLGSVGRGHMRMKVADQRDWFSVEGGAQLSGQSPIVPLHELLEAIREDRRYVAVGARGFARIEESLREALTRAEPVLFAGRSGLQIARVATDPLIGLVEAEAQIDASGDFRALRRRMSEGDGEPPQLPAPLAAALRPYQQQGVAWLARLSHWGAGALLADEMGLGKTIQTLAALSHRAERGPALVVAPTSVAPNWLVEAARFAPALKVRLYRGPEREPLLRGLHAGDVVVTSYAIAALDAEALAKVRFASLVLDEAQAVKNATTERARALRELDVEWRLGLTGTPIENHLGELWSILRLITPGLLGSWEQFRARYSMPIEKFGDDTRRKKLAAVIRPFVLRRTKAEVAADLPPRTEVVRVLRLSPEEEDLYEQLRKSVLDDLERAKNDPERDGTDRLRMVLLASFTRLRQLCCHPRLVYPRSPAGSAKAAYLLELLGELREDGHKALVFSQFRSFLEILAPRLRQHGFRVLVLDGTTPAEVREQRIAAFQRGEADVFLISLKAGGFGLNLTAADTVIHLDPWWNPAVEDQATARAHRIGQSKPVTAVRLVARGTIEEAVLDLHADKRALAAGILDGTEAAATLSTEDLIDLIRRVSTPAP
jgi:superfamily II DNA or RNA helicase